MLTRRQVIISAAAAGAATAFRGAIDSFAAAPQPATAVNFQVPPRTTDTHRHIFGDLQRYPYAPNSGYRHEPATVDDMRKLDQAMRIERVVLIQPSGYGTDNSCLLDGLKRLGPKSRGVVAIDEKTTDKALDDMDRAGVRGIRLNTGQNVSEARLRLRDAARRLAGRKWHINTALQLPILEGLQEDMMGLPVPVVIDHYSGSHAADGIHQPGFDVLLKLLKGGNIYVKLSRLHNVSNQAPGYADVEPLAKALMAANSQRLLWGTDWPHAGIRPPGYKPTDISPYFQYDDGLIFNEFAAWAADPARRQTILVDNPARLYGFSG